MLQCCVQAPIDTDVPATYTNGSTSLLKLYCRQPTWAEDSKSIDCASCHAVFDTFVRKHHCRSCGDVFCAECASQFERVIKLGFVEPVRTCTSCLQLSRRDNAFYEVHLPMMEHGAVLQKHGMLTKRYVFFEFNRSQEIFLYQTCEADGLSLTGDIKCIELEKITDITESGEKMLVIVTPEKVHKLDAPNSEIKSNWIHALRSIQGVYTSALTQARLRLAQRESEENAMMRKMALDMMVADEKKIAMERQRQQRNKVKREHLRAKYNLNKNPTAA